MGMGLSVWQGALVVVVVVVMKGSAGGKKSPWKITRKNYLNKGGQDTNEGGHFGPVIPL